jgi:hypothetical protein
MRGGVRCGSRRLAIVTADLVICGTERFPILLRLWNGEESLMCQCHLFVRYLEVVLRGSLYA